MTHLFSNQVQFLFLSTMESKAFFKVDPRLASLLGENYRSSEAALKELVDNSWDADATCVQITLPKPLTQDPIVIKDNGSGMTTKELKVEYLTIASSRLSRKGKYTNVSKRKVKGRKGIGKFAGLLAANLMKIETCVRGKKTVISIPKKKLLEANRDLERVELFCEISDCSDSLHGTSIILTDLNQNLSFPNPDKLRSLLVLEYGRSPEFDIYVNGELIGIEDIPGKTFFHEFDIPDVGKGKLQYTISDADSTIRKSSSGIVVRVNGKAIGKPTHFNLEEDPEIPGKLLKRVYGELEVDGLEDDVTADWGAFIENSLGYSSTQNFASDNLRGGLTEVFQREINLAKGRLTQKIDRQLSQLPEYKQEYARRALENVMKRFFGESDERVEAVINVILETFQRYEYWSVIKEISEAKHYDIETFSNALAEFGLVDMAMMAAQAQRRMKFLDELDSLIGNEKTLEKDIHHALESNLWVFGVEYSVLSSNKTLKRFLETYLGKKFIGKRSKKRPDLFLGCDLNERHLLIEFKRPIHTISRLDGKCPRVYPGLIARIVVDGTSAS
ncbi:MAG: ATP-binding protein, partial [Cyanobacteria bacterium]|nr:ATP-binding protein [Cyanobacteriota bacterium]